MLERPGIETVVLKDFRFAPEAVAAPRLTLVLPSLSKADAFGGLTTALDFFLALGLAARPPGAGLDLRILTEEVFDPEDSALPRHLKRAGLAPEAVEVLSLRDTGLAVPTRENEVFVVFNWWIALNIDPVLKAQAAHYGRPPLPKLYLIQEYEPLFYSFSSAHMLALEAFNPSWPLWAIVNSSELAGYYRDQGNRAERLYVFEPRIVPEIAPFREKLEEAVKERVILVYGRPMVKRNCFSILERGLALWAGTGGAEGWRIVSAGMKHPDVPLARGARIESLGKLSLEDYGRLLRRTAIGISLMASPHPSYPPLEMAHFGIRTITNRYRGKNLSERHENIVSLADVLPATLADTIAATVAAYEADPAGGLRGRTFMPDYLSDTPFDCLPALAADLAALLADRLAGSRAAAE